MNKVLCSVVIPTRDCLAYLPAALGSVSLQGRDDVDIIIADDGSSDGTQDWLLARRDRLPPIRIVETGGVGPAGARNAAIAAASAPLIAFLDADDIWWPNKLNAQLRWHVMHPETGFSFTDYLHVDEEGRSRGTCFDYWRTPLRTARGSDFRLLPDAELTLLSINLVGTSTVVASRETILRAGGFSPMPSAQDWDLWLRLAAMAPVAFSPAVTTTYLMRAGSVTSKAAQRLAVMRQILARYEGRREGAIRHALRQAHSRVAAAEAELARSEGRVWRAVRSGLAALVRQPSWRLARSLAADCLRLPTIRKMHG